MNSSPRFQLHWRTVRSALLWDTMAIAAITAMFFVARPAVSYLQQIQSSATAPANLRWDFTAFPVQWNHNPDTSSAKVSGDRSPADVIAASFQAWLDSPNIALTASRGPDISLNSPAVDGINLICFICTGDFNKDSQTLAVTLSVT